MGIEYSGLVVVVCADIQSWQPLLTMERAQGAFVSPPAGIKAAAS